MVLPLAAATGLLLLIGESGIKGGEAAARGSPVAVASGISPLAAVDVASLLAVATGDCAEASVAHSKKQNNAGKMILMEKSTTVQFCGAGARGLS